MTPTPRHPLPGHEPRRPLEGDGGGPSELAARYEAARRSERTYRALYEHHPMAMWVYDPDTLRILSVNPAAVALYGYTEAEFLELTLDRLRAPADAADFLAKIDEARRGDRLVHHARHLTRDGRVRDVTVTGHPVEFDGRPARLVLVEDVTERRAAEGARRASEARFRAVFDHAAVGILLVDWEGRVVDSNPALQRLLGYDADELRGMPTARMSPPEEASVTREPVRELKAGLRDRVFVEKRYRRRSGEELVCELMVTRVDDGTASFMLGMMHDVTERKRMEDELTRRAFHDPLTGLANRALFRDRVEHALARLASGRGGATAVLFFDLDGFKRVNDSLGHLQGDRLLETMADRLRAATRAADTVARFGGDEFAVLLEDLDDVDGAAAAAERALAALGAPVPLDGGGGAITVGASVGIALRLGPGDAGGDESADALLREADAAMYAAKGRGRGQWARFEPEMHRRAVERLRLEADLRGALERGELSVHYQPIVELEDGRVRGMVSPAEFIPVAEETGLIVPLGRFVLREACAHAASWRPPAAPGAAPVGISVNLSARQLDDPHLVADVRDALDAAGLAPERLTLEITESALTHDASLALARLHALKALGVRLAVDDFGTGYASLNYLQRFPIDVLKVDKSFVDRVARQEQDAALVRTVIALGQALRLHVVAEGIEQPDQRAALAELGCRYGQGYLYARPLPPAEAAEYLEGGALAGPLVGTP